MKSSFTFFLGAVAGLFSLAAASRAAVVAYAIDPARSSLALTFQIDATGSGEAWEAVAVQPLSYTGTISGDLSGNTLTFSNPSATSLVASPHPGGPFPPAGSGVDNHGVSFSLFPNIDNGFIAFRDIAFTIPSGILQHGSPSSAPFVFTAGHAGWALPPSEGTGSQPFAAASSENFVNFSDASLPATLALEGTTETLTLPVALFHPDLPGLDRTRILFEGTIVATRIIPEPAAAAFGALGLLGLLRRRR